MSVPCQVYGCSVRSGPRPGCFVCPWAAARPRAVRAASFARRVVSKPGQAPPPPTGTAARPSRPRVGFWLPDPATATGAAGGFYKPHSASGRDNCCARDALSRWREGIRMGPARKGRPHCCRGIEPAGDVAATCRPGSWRRGSCRPWRPGRPARSRGRHAGRRWYGRSRKRGRQAASARRRAGRQASCRPS